MGLTTIQKLRRAASQIRNRFRPGVLILLYHRIVETPSDPYLLNVTPQHFKEHLEILRKQGCTVMHLQELTQALQDGTLPHRAVVVTFDDGYVDNLCNAKPLLEHHEIPATVFVTSGYVGQDREFWWDELDRLLLQPGTLPKTLDLKIQGKTFEWVLDDDAYYNKEHQQCDRSWHLYQQHDPTQRHQVFRSLHHQLNALPFNARWPILHELAEWAGTEVSSRPTHRLLSANELVELAKGDLIHIGAHTVSHPVLSALPVSAQKEEIWQSKVDLENILDRPVVAFAYPHGARSDYTQDTVRLVKAAGFICACSNFPEMVWQNSDYFQLPRILIYDWNGEKFEKELKKWIKS